MLRQGFIFLALAGCCVTLPSLHGCSPAGALGPDGAPPPVETQVPVQYERVTASHPAPPEWLYVVPADEDGLLYQIGLSDYHRSEREAREDAYRHALKQFAAYAGVDVSVLETVVRTLNGRSGAVLDGSVEERDGFSQSLSAFVSRIKADSWYWEEYRVLRDGVFRGNVYKYWVKTSVPVDEYRLVQERRQQREAEAREARERAEAEARAQREREETEAREEVEELFTAHRELLGRIDASLEQGQVAEALGRIQGGWDRLFDAAAGFSARGGLFAAAVPRVREAQQEVLGRVAQIRGGLYFDAGRFDSVCVPSDPVTPVPVWLGYRHGGRVTPVAGMGIQLRSQEGEGVARAVTDGNGRAEFSWPGTSVRRLWVAIDLEDAAMSSLDRTLSAAIASVERCLTVVEFGSDLEGAVSAAVHGLFAGPSADPLPARRMLLGPVTHAETGRGSSFAEILKRQLRNALTKVDGLEVVEPRRHSAAELEKANSSRGIGGQEKSVRPGLGSAAVQASIDGADTALESTYSLLGDKVRLDLSLRQAGSNVVVKASSAFIAKERLPADLPLLPPEPSSPSLRPEPLSRGMRLEVISHLGDGQTYEAGERISYFVNTDQDAYLLLVYEDASRNLIQILPNAYSSNRRHRAGSFIEVPAPGDPFEFVIEPPFGVEQVWAFASSRPFPRLNGKTLENGLVVLSGAMPSIIKGLRDHAAELDALYAEAQTTITTVPGEKTIARH